ncbi:MAG: hypothetical protein K2Y17_10130 [Qipengyuania sp.]|nr:hypothetical protein [Qipengyuania sp.]
MRALVYILLLAGLVIGLAAHSAALAAEPCPMGQAHTSPMAGQEDCCPEGECAGEEKGAPWDDLALSCLAMAGCATLGALDSTAMARVAEQGPGASQFWTIATPLDGWSVPPDTHPPALLG